jgi:L-lactate dehydrogenase complex protein LldF
MDETAQFDFKANIARALGDRQLRSNLKSAMDGLVLKRLAVFPDAQELETLRQQGQAIKRRALSKLPQLLEQLERKCTENGIRVHWAETSLAADQTVLDILQRHNAVRLAKGKSMVSEEMHLNDYLAHYGIEVVETDLGEFIIQLEGEPPSHIIVPAVHKNKDQIARTFQAKIPGAPYTEVVEELNAIARRTLRQKFFDCEVGLSGVNFAVAETGTLCLVENEGNGRMCTTVPPVHIAVMGVEKVVEKLEEVPPLLRLLTGSATGQIITTYVNMITSPRKAGERDGPKEVHLILLDNGRSEIFADPELRQTLHCIRCGTCLNHCPVYTRLGGHAYGYVYPGPIGKILTPQLEGLAPAGDLATASTLCNACEEVCPVKIPIPALIRRIRNESCSKAGSDGLRGRGYRRRPLEAAAWRIWEKVNTRPFLNAVGGRLLGFWGNRLPNVGPLDAWTRSHARPKFARKSLHRLMKETGAGDDRS